VPEPSPCTARTEKEGLGARELVEGLAHALEGDVPGPFELRLPHARSRLARLAGVAHGQDRLRARQYHTHTHIHRANLNTCVARSIQAVGDTHTHTDPPTSVLLPPMVADPISSGRTLVLLRPPPRHIPLHIELLPFTLSPSAARRRRRRLCTCLAMATASSP
jgi:hypothetical protein